MINSSYKELVIKAVKQDGNVLRYININLQNDKEVILKAVKQIVLLYKILIKILKMIKKFIKRS